MLQLNYLGPNSIPIYFRNIDDNDKFKIKIKNILFKNPFYNVSEFHELKWTLKCFFFTDVAKHYSM